MIFVPNTLETVDAICNLKAFEALNSIQDSFDLLLMLDDVEGALKLAMVENKATWSQVSGWALWRYKSNFQSFDRSDKLMVLFHRLAAEQTRYILTAEHAKKAMEFGWDYLRAIIMLNDEDTEEPVVDLWIGYQAKHPEGFTDDDVKVVDMVLPYFKDDCGYGPDVYNFWPCMMDNSKSWGVRKIEDVPLSLVLRMQADFERDPYFREIDATEYTRTLKAFMGKDEVVFSNWMAPPGVEIFKLKPKDFQLDGDDYQSEILLNELREHLDEDFLVDVLHVDPEEVSQEDQEKLDEAVLQAQNDLAGWYWWYCEGCSLPDSSPNGPHKTVEDAIRNSVQDYY